MSQGSVFVRRLFSRHYLPTLLIDSPAYNHLQRRSCATGCKRELAVTHVARRVCRSAGQASTSEPGDRAAQGAAVPALDEPPTAEQLAQKVDYFASHNKPLEPGNCRPDGGMQN